MFGHTYGWQLGRNQDDVQFCLSLGSLRDEIMRLYGTQQPDEESRRGLQQVLATCHSRETPTMMHFLQTRPLTGPPGGGSRNDTGPEPWARALEAG